MVSKPKVRRPPDNANWIGVEKARHLQGGGVLRPRLIEHPEADGRLVLPKPKFFRGDGSAIQRNGNGAALYDAASIDLRGAFSGGTSVVQFGMQLSDQEHTERPYAENVWVRAGVKAFSNGFSKLPLQFFDKDADEEKAREIETPLTKLFQRPNKAMSQLEFFRAHVVNYKHDGEVYWFLMDSKGRPVATNEDGFITALPEQILPIRGAKVDVVLDESGFPEWYRYRRQSRGTDKKGEFAWFEAAAVIPFLDYDPYNMVRGLGDVKALIREIDLYFQAYRYLDAVVKNGGDPGGFIVYEERIGDAELDRRQGEADDEYSLTNAGRYKVLDRGAKFVPNKTTPKDMQYGTLFEWQREAILAGIGTPPPVVGVLGDAIYNNIETARREMWKGPNGILTVIELTEDVLRNKLIWRLQRLVGDVWPHFDTSRVEALSIDREEKIDRASTIAARGHGVSMNEMLALQGVDGEYPESGKIHLFESKFVIPKEEADAAGIVPPPAPESPTKEKVDDDTEDVEGEESETASGLRVVTVDGIRLVDDERSPACKMKGEAKSKCVSRKVPEILGENPGMKQSQAVAIAFSLCSKACGGSATVADVETRQGKGVGRSAVKETGEPDPTLTDRLETWLTAYEKAQIQKLDAFARTVDADVLVSAFLETVQKRIQFRVEITAEDFELLALNHAEWAARLGRGTRVPIRSIWASALAFARDQVGGPFLRVTDPRIAEMIASQVLQLAEGVTSTTALRVRNAILRVLTGADDVPLIQAIKDALPDLTEELRKVFGSKDARATAISITEVGRAQNSAAFEQMREAGVTKHRWRDSGDAQVRPPHQISEEVVLGQKFSNGLRYPHDPLGSASQVVGCRCKTQVVEQEELEEVTA